MDPQENGPRFLFHFLIHALIAYSVFPVDQEVFPVLPDSQEWPAKMECQVFQVLKVNELLVKQVTISDRSSIEPNFFFFVL